RATRAQGEVLASLVLTHGRPHTRERASGDRFYWSGLLRLLTGHRLHLVDLSDLVLATVHDPGNAGDADRHRDCGQVDRQLRPVQVDVGERLHRVGEP